ncbi:hypothetical protein BcepSauron_237 [Burkholderia phage BcepSauron]|uniref:Uncharacterized protein n=1 Tax=Burkholderia phage BcepSauron TaxID=2530033 RepID=A0A482MKQ6_9CAUD|nr:hypothetical protein H1O17_gp237 [Burkholderia phage BcepSauron]QBQ74617.1 hypothetical protein BcepSauron_237 [Burkholderia phage BcepSauron]
MMFSTTAYHSSNFLFDFPVQAKANANRKYTDRHANGLLGLWCSVTERGRSAFGRYLYEFEIDADWPSVLNIKLSTLFGISDPTELRDLRKTWLDNGTKVVRLSECDQVFQAIVLDFRVIKNWHLVEEKK